MKPWQLDGVRYALLGAVLAAPVILFAVLRPRSGVDVPAYVWAELPLAAERREYTPRTPVFDGARRSISVGAARGETAAFLVRVQAREPVAQVLLEADALERRGGPPAPRVPLVATVRRVERGSDGGARLVAPSPSSLARGAQGEWLVEVAVPAAAAPGPYAARLTVRGGGDTLERLGVTLSVWGYPLGPCAPAFGGADRAAAWRAAAAGTLPAAPGRCAQAAPPADLGALARRELDDDLRHLASLRGRGEPMAEAVVRRVAAAPPATPEGWDAVRRELVGLLNAPGR